MHKNNDTHQTIDYYDSTKLKNVFAKHQDDGFVNGEDLKVIMFEVGRHLTDNEIMDKDGVVSTTDLRLALSYGSDIHFSYDDIISIVRKLSNSDNGYVTFQDFDKFMDST
uniref:uncharacterized protein LOC100186011 isoform X4 n=1 Tax=Ciona intestinalis TaxID=7719 RepID=UPI000180B774|nr:uncharacterized protein LOC100186011 isoform X4 [Ciona intestinalis]|eukprot:XP_009858108.1 uncharacterized protein LOC100186011 isoform X4 [Ciona intestinalis]